jgi:hypothetical protein
LVTEYPKERWVSGVFELVALIGLESIVHLRVCIFQPPKLGRARLYLWRSDVATDDFIE